ncbi:MAG: DUF2635 domain-containing protein [Chitinispirillia bacterium]|nr:DUF2635 domain-containing protein [Chitinispirillia bacterium]
MRTLRVIAKEGCLCPRENRKDAPIDDKTPVEVDSTPYYIRRISDGSLVIAELILPSAPVKESKPAPSAKANKEEAK